MSDLAAKPLGREAGFGCLFEAVFDAVAVCRDGRIVDANPGFSAIFGYARWELAGLAVEGLVEPQQRARLADRLARGRGGRFSLNGVDLRGRRRLLEATVRAVPGDGSRLLVIRDVTDQTLAEEQVGVLAYQYAADLTVVAEVARRLPRSAGAAEARRAICEGALEVCDGMAAVLMEPDAAGTHLIATAVAGPRSGPLPVAVDEVGTATAQVYASGEPFFVADLAGHPGVPAHLTEASGAASALWQPVLRDGRVVGVLLVAWDRELAHLSDRAAAVVGLFAAEAAVAIERADVLAQLGRLNEALAEQVSALRESDRYKSDFVSSVSHELRTPLASILGYLDVLGEGAAGELTGEQREFLAIIDNNARRLLALINDLLTLSGIESGATVVRPRPADLAALVRAALADHEPVLSSRGQQLHRELPDRPLRAMVDPERIGQVIANLLSNASKFTPDGGRLRVSLSEVGAVARLDVADSGIGVATDDLPRLFERFFRASSATDQAIPGTGLGLAICKGIVDAHRGRMTVQSRLGEGTCVTLVLPLDGDDE